MVSVTPAAAARALASLAQLAWPKVRQLRAERLAARPAVRPPADLLATTWDETLDRLRGGVPDEAWWKRVLDSVGHALVAPDFFRVASVREWLAQRQVRADLAAIATARVLGHAEDDAEARERLRQAYMRCTGEAARLADDRVDVALAVLAAGFVAGVEPAHRVGIAYQQAAVVENRGLHLETQGQIGEIREAIAARGPDHHVVREHSRLVLQELALALKRRSLDAQGARSSARTLLARLEDDLRHADRPSQSQVAYWAARLDAAGPTAAAEVTALRDRALELDPGLDTRVVDALLAEARGDGQGALRLLAGADDPDIRGVLFRTLSQVRGQEAALAWFDEEPSRDDPSFLTGIGWCNLAAHLAEAGRWEEAADRLAAAHAAHVADWPELAFFEGVVNAALLLPPELRHLALAMNLFYPGLSVLEGPEADGRRAVADACFAEAVTALEQIAAPRRAQAARDWRLWLRLISPEPDIARAARGEVADGMHDGERSIDLVPFAHAFGVPFDPDPLRRRLARCKLLGDTDERAVLAEFILAQASMTPAERADFLEREEARLATVILAGNLVGMRVEALAQAGRLGQARQLLGERGAELSAADTARLEALVEDFAGSDPRPRLERLWKNSGELLDLRNLAGHLRRIRDWSALQPLLHELFRRERNLRNARGLVECLRHDRLADPGDVLSFLDANQDLVARDDDLAAEGARALLHLGRLDEARGVNDGLLSRRRDQSDLALDINLALQEGDWERFPAIVDREWPRRGDHDPQTLLGLAQLAAQGDATADRAFALAELAAERSPDDPGVLVAAHALAIQLGRDGDANPRWLARALELSSEDGPVRAFDLRTVVERVLPERRDHVDSTIELWTRGQIPIHAAVSALGSTLSRLLLGASSRNQAQRDGRRKTIIPTLAGNRAPVQIEAEWVVGLDLTSTLVLQRLGLLRRALEALDGVALAPDTMIVLLNDRRQARFHQPSRVRAAEEVRALIDTGGLRAMVGPSAEPPPWLMHEVGDELACLLAAARAEGGMVVHPSPVRKVSSFTGEPADLRDYEDVVISVSAFVALLRREGELDRGAVDRAQTRLRTLGDAGGPSAESLCGPAGKVIYLDGLAIDYLQASGILARVAAAGLDLRIHPRLRDEQSALVEANQEGEALAREIDDVRSALREARLAGRATFLPRGVGDEEGRLRDLMAAASTLLGFLRHLGHCVAVACDDRMVNRNPTLSDREGRSVPTVCVPDILRFLQKRERITEAERWDALHGLRLGGFALVPLEAGELEARLRHAPARDGDPLVESSELRAVRQNLARLAGLEAIEPRSEGGYVDHLSLVAVEVACRLWVDDNVPVARALACTDWVWRYVAFRAASWVPEPRDRGADDRIGEALLARLAVWLQPMPGVARDRHRAFLEWLDREVLWPLLPANADLVDQLADRIGSNIELWSEEAGGDEQDGPG